MTCAELWGEGTDRVYFNQMNGECAAACPAGVSANDSKICPVCSDVGKYFDKVANACVDKC